MYRKLIRKLILFSIIAYLVHSEEHLKLYCPNAQLPEVDDNGNAKQCLPGHDELCGSGYTCHFSGTNYQCCPIEEEINLDSILECPSPSITILTDVGLPLTCIPGLHDCPQSSMQCVNVGKNSICCEGLSSIMETSDGAHSPNELNMPEETMQPIILNNELNTASNLDCPEPAFTVLDAHGDPISCSEEDCTHQRRRFCHKTLNATICCEGEEKDIDDETLIEKILQEKQEQERNSGWNVLNYTPLTTAQRQLHNNELLRTDNRPGIDVSNVAKLPVVDENTPEALARRSEEKQIGGRYNKTPQQSISSHNMQTSPRTATAISNTATTTFSDVTTPTTLKHQLFRKPNEDETETIRYKPHSAGGYAVSQAFSPKISSVSSDLRALAREYLLEHIKQGWPYNDKFYRNYTLTSIEGNYSWKLKYSKPMVEYLLDYFQINHKNKDNSLNYTYLIRNFHISKCTFAALLESQSDPEDDSNSNDQT